MADLRYDSRVNYQKIKTNDTVTLSVANPSSSTSTTIVHGLGYYPNVRVWFTNNAGLISTAVSDAAGSNLAGITSGFTQLSCFYKVSTSGLTITLSRGVTVGTTRTSTIYFRIYYDAA